MDYKEVSKLGATLTAVHISFRYWKAAFALNSESPAPAVDAAYRWFTALVDELTGEVAPQKISAPKEPASEEAQEAHAGMLEEPTRVPDGDGTADIRALPGPLMIAHVVSESGTHYGKILGGKFTKFGISVWPEVLGAAGINGWEDWPVALSKRTGLEGEKRALPPTMAAFVLFDGDKPQKVTELR